MAKRQYIDYKKIKAELFKRTEGYAANVRQIYRDAFEEIINLVKGTELEPGKPFSFSEYGYSDEVTPILRNMYSRVYQTIRKGVEKEWLTANEHNDGLVKAVFGDSAIEDNHFARYFKRNMEAMNAFFERKTYGLNLSQKVWKYTGIYKDELEDALDLAIGEGTGANLLAKKIQQYLNEPDRFYRRFRVKIGEDEDGKPIYGRVWKRRIYDKEAQSYKWIDDDPRKYHPGRGVYRSSYRNAQRLARTETNIAYRTADYERWQQLDFVIGIEIKLSNNHPDADICDDLKGIYPKDFKWTGWHPNCRCYQQPVLCKDEELDAMLEKILEGESPASVECADEVEQPPQAFKTWIKDNEERMEQAAINGTMPYFVKDNTKIIDNILHGLTPEQKAAMAMSDILDNPLGLLEKHGMDALNALYGAVQSKLGQMLTGTLEHQVDTLKFEIDWVTQHKKYDTWEGAANAYKKALEKVELQLRRERMVADMQAVEAFATGNNVETVTNLYSQLKAAYDAGDIDTALRLLGEAQNAIQDYKTALLRQGMNSTTALEKYCDKHRTFESKVKSDKSFAPFQERMIKESGPAWQSASDDARMAVRRYTNGDYDDINRSYWKYGKEHTQGKQMDEILDGCKLSKDTVLRRGCNLDEMGSIFGDDFLRMARAGDIDGLNAVAGCRGVNEGFISTSFDMQGGFWKEVDLRIYAPKGTQAFYAKPVSGFGDCYGEKWDGLSARTSFVRGRENEVIVHRGYEYRFIKAEQGGKKGSSITIYIELLSRDKRLVR